VPPLRPHAPSSSFFPPPAHAVPFEPAAGEIHGNINNPKDPDSWRPSWLKPLDGAKDTRKPSEQVDSDAIANQLERELSTPEVHAENRGDLDTAVPQSRSMSSSSGSPTNTVGAAETLAQLARQRSASGYEQGVKA